MDNTPRNHHALPVLVVMMGVSPFLWALSQEMTVLFLQLASLLLLWQLSFVNSIKQMLPFRHWLFLLALILIVLLYLLPLPFTLWSELPGRTVYAEVLQQIPLDIRSDWRSISLSASLSESALLSLFPLLVVYLLLISLSFKDLKLLLMLMILIAVVQSVIGLVQYGGGIQLPGHELYKGAARGTYLNRDHLAGFLEMVFPVVLALLAVKLGHRDVHSRGSRRHRWHFWATLQGNQSLIYAALAVLIILCLIFTRSRAGIALTMIGMLIALFAFARRLGGNNIYGTYGTVLAIIIVLAIEIGLAPVLDRFSQDPMQDLRWEIYATSMNGVADFFPLGSGMGTFSAVYPVYQIPHHDHFINHVHNDYLEWVFEGGLAMAVLIIYGLYLYFAHWKQVWIRQQWNEFRFIQVGAGIGVFLMLLHSTIDFNLHKPVNALYFVFLLAVFMKPNHRQGGAG